MAKWSQNFSKTFQDFKKFSTDSRKTLHKIHFKTKYLSRCNVPPSFILILKSSKNMMFLLFKSETELMRILRDANNFKKIWHRKISEIDLIRKKIE